MDNRQLRAVLVSLQDRLSVEDRARLHFYLKNEVPRMIGDDSTLTGTLKLMDSLFDQDKINDTDFDLLIDAFTQIRCLDAAQTLKSILPQIKKSFFILFVSFRISASYVINWFKSFNIEFIINDANKNTIDIH